jgi:hypothetical protein
MHILSTSYRLFWDLLTRGLRNDLQSMIYTSGWIKLAHILRSIQLVCYSWFNHRRARLQPPNPEFADILHRITLQSYVLPHLPPALFRLAYPASTFKISGNTSTVLSLTNTYHLSTPSDTSTIVSTLTTPTINTPKPSAVRGSFQANLMLDSTLQSLVPANIKLKDLISQDAPPLGDNNAPLCLSYHMHQGCWSTCKLVANHNKTLLNEEKQWLANFALA